MFRMLVLNAMDSSTIGILNTDVLPRIGERVRIETQGEEIQFDLYVVTDVVHEYLDPNCGDMQFKNVYIRVTPAVV